MQVMAGLAMLPCCPRSLRLHLSLQQRRPSPSVVPSLLPRPIMSPLPACIEAFLSDPTFVCVQQKLRSCLRLPCRLVCHPLILHIRSTLSDGKVLPPTTQGSETSIHHSLISCTDRSQCGFLTFTPERSVCDKFTLERQHTG